MPRDGAGIYHTPAGTDGVSGNVISSNAYNINVHDVERDLNEPRPIVAGGTGATSVDGALTALKGEKANQVVDDFITHAWLPGSFSARGTAINGPVDGQNHYLAGIVYVMDEFNMVIEARDLDDGTEPGSLWVRKKWANNWGAWYKTEPVPPVPAAATVTEARAGTDNTKLLTPYNHKKSHQPMFAAVGGSQTGIALGSFYPVLGMTETSDPDGSFNGTSFEPGWDGFYLVGGTVEMPTLGSTIGVAILLNGGATNFAEVDEGGSTHTAKLSVTGMIYLSGSDYVQLAGMCDYAPAPAFNNSMFWAFRVGPLA